MSVPEKKKRIGMLKQIAALFAIGVLLIGLMTSLALYSVSQKHVRDDMRDRAHAVAVDAASYVNHFPAHKWLLRYWSENYVKMNLEYDVYFDADSNTAEKYKLLNSHQPDFQMDYASDADAEALPPEDQQLFAEIIYAWFNSRLDSMAKGYDCDYLYCVITEKPYDSQRILFIVANKDLERGPETGKLYPIGTVITSTAKRQEAMRSAAEGIPQTTPNEDGKYIDYYYRIDSFDGHDILIGVTGNIWVVNKAVKNHTLSLSFHSILFLILLALACLLLVLLIILQPLKIVQENIRLYKHTKDSGIVIDNLSQIKSYNEIGELSEDVIELTKELDDYTKRVEKISSEKERINTELSLASNIQMAMMPGKFPAFPDRNDFDIYASIKPAREVGGDFYDFFLIDDSHLALMIADVSGKGVPAALFVMAIKITLSHYFKMGKSPAQILTDVNRAINTNNPEDMFITIWLGILDLKTGRLTAANAGHEYPVLKNGDRFELFKDKHSFVVGSMPDVKYSEYEIRLTQGSTLFLYSDGLPEATASDFKQFGTARIVDELNRNPDVSPQELTEKMHEAVADFVQDAEQFDDLTMMCVTYKG